MKPVSKVSKHPEDSQPHMTSNPDRSSANWTQCRHAVRTCRQRHSRSRDPLRTRNFAWTCLA